MKTFQDLKFKPHPNDQEKGKMAQLFFSNGYGVSVVRFRNRSPNPVDALITSLCAAANGSAQYGYGSYTKSEKEWELAVLKGNKKKWDICYTTPITSDVIGFLSVAKVTQVMKKVQGLK